MATSAVPAPVQSQIPVAGEPQRPVALQVVDRVWSVCQYVAAIISYIFYTTMRPYIFFYNLAKSAVNNFVELITVFSLSIHASLLYLQVWIRFLNGMNKDNEPSETVIHTLQNIGRATDNIYKRLLDSKEAGSNNPNNPEPDRGSVYSNFPSPVNSSELPGSNSGGTNRQNPIDGNSGSNNPLGGQPLATARGDGSGVHRKNGGNGGTNGTVNGGTVNGLVNGHLGASVTWGPSSSIGDGGYGGDHSGGSNSQSTTSTESSDATVKEVETGRSAYSSTRAGNGVDETDKFVASKADPRKSPSDDGRSPARSPNK